MRSSVLAIVLDSSKERFLAIKRRDVTMWVFPGGGVEQDELPDAAAIREVFEETGCRVVISRTVAVYTPVNRLATTTFLFECLIVEGEPIIGEEAREIGFFSYDSPPSPFFHIHKELLLDAQRREPKIIFKPFSQVTYWALLKYTLRHPCQVFRFACSRLGFPINSN